MAAPDPQKEPLYRWEAKWCDWNRKTITLPEARAYVRTACAYYGVQPPTVTSHGGRALSFYQSDAVDHAVTTTVKGSLRSHISFNRESGMNIPTALHEAAHAIAVVLLPWNMPDHDPRFVGIYLWLLRKAKVAPRQALEASLKEARVKWAGASVHPRYLVQ